MRPDAVTLLFKEAFDIFPPLEGKPTDDDLLAIREALLPILMVIPFDAVGGIHSLTALLMDEAKYAVAHGGNKFVRPVRLPLYNELILDDCDNIHPWISTTSDLAFSHQQQFTVLNSQKGFRRSLPEISLFSLSSLFD